ncbi:histone deacetylase [Actinosynnema sp. NPDC047251]|uniref:Putative deacetylase n=1 Tax=Saccharothrix espanaensis (strain ATCC 51144 / DSM 44229 / JCM 9112 / NBRC 15066 / NRRL 15764) TaxID=1179773 RepID=K0K6Z0_SACES|nr:deacetylase [Saccharothrix espanaensis]CCH33307.1 putative deacetylase [Saccharothrix espanaensis DSM 44229]
MSHVWYVSYGSNLYADRFACYLRGGVPVGAAHAYPGCRDGSPPRAVREVEAPGGIYFATRSPVWGGGRAFFDPGLPGTAAMRGYLITTGQFADVVEQEMYREPGPEIDLTTVLAEGRDQRGPGRYDTLLRLGEFAGHPALTFTAPWSAGDVEHTAPSGPYLKMLRDGLCESHGWTTARAAAYLAGRTTFWTGPEVERL